MTPAGDDAYQQGRALGNYVVAFGVTAALSLGVWLLLRRLDAPADLEIDRELAERAAAAPGAEGSAVRKAAIRDAEEAAEDKASALFARRCAKGSCAYTLLLLLLGAWMNQQARRIDWRTRSPGAACSSERSGLASTR